MSEAINMLIWITLALNSQLSMDAVKSISSDASSLPKANNHLAVELMKFLCKEGGNVFFSPFSLSTALAMVYLGAKGETSEELRGALGYHAANISDEVIISAYHSLILDFEKTPDHYTLSSANSILIQKDFPVKEKYKNLVSETFKALMLNVDFTNDVKKVLRQINNWVKDKTRDMIPQLLGDLDPSTEMVLLNAIYFKGTWLQQFDPKKTSSQHFYNDGVEKDAKKVKMMHIRDNYLYVELETFKALQLPYKGGDIAMIVLLPHEKNGVNELGNKLSSSFIQDLQKDMRKRRVDVALPKFRLDYSKSLVGSFQSMGMKKVFNSNADFDGISDVKRLLVSEIFHKAVLVVNEEGSEAAAATAVFRTLKRPRPRPTCCTFVVDHPFMFAIFDTRKELILFMGKVNKL